MTHLVLSPGNAVNVANMTCEWFQLLTSCPFYIFSSHEKCVLSPESSNAASLDFFDQRWDCDGNLKNKGKESRDLSEWVKEVGKNKKKRDKKNVVGKKMGMQGMDDLSLGVNALVLSVGGENSLFNSFVSFILWCSSPSTSSCFNLHLYPSLLFLFDFFSPLLSHPSSILASSLILLDLPLFSIWAKAFFLLRACPWETWSVSFFAFDKKSSVIPLKKFNERNKLFCPDSWRKKKKLHF